MKNIILLGLTILFIGCNQKDQIKKAYSYPIVPSKPTAETYFDTTITDEYRNLENLKDELVDDWFKKEALFTDSILNTISGREGLIQKMKSYDQRKTALAWSVKVTENDQYFFLKQKADENVPRLFYRKSFDSEDELLFDAKDFKPRSGNTYIINYIQPSWDGSYIALAMSHSGAEISEMAIIDMKTRKILPQIISHCWPSDGGGVSWLPDNSGFMYLHYPEIDHTSDRFLKDMKSVLYKIGDNPEDLNVIFSRETHPDLGIAPEDFPIASLISKNDNYLIGYIGGATAYGDAYFAEVKDLHLQSKIQWKPLYKKEDKVDKVIFEGDDIIFTSAKNSPQFQLLETTMANLNIDKAAVLSNQKQDEVIRTFGLTSDGIYYSTINNGVQGKLYNIKDGFEKEIKLPRISGRLNFWTKGKDFSDLWISSAGWKNEYIRYQYDSKTNTFSEANLVPKANYPEFDDLIVKEALVTAHDGEKIPLSIIHKKDIQLNGEIPTLLLGYGSYGISYRPFFSATRLTWVDEGGIFCIAHVRGGGEKGDQWYQNGKKTKKPNTWKDLISCTEYMINEGYTSNSKTVIHGGSAGGILIGRAMTERPDLFAVAIPEVGMMNPLRNENTPNGPNNTKEFGISKDPVECKALIEMDAYLHIEKGVKYPATFITTGMNDPRVIAWQPGKFAAKLQAYNGSDKPILFDVDYESGHGIGDSKLKEFEQLANVYSFAFWQTGHTDYQPK